MHLSVSNVQLPFCDVNSSNCKLSDEEISKLSTRKCGYGQGIRLDEQKRPFCALDFNSQFSKKFTIYT